jgi:CBS domain-containing protein
MLERIPVEGVYRRAVETVPERCPLPDILRIVGKSRSSTFPVTDERGALVGVLSFAALLLEENLGPLVVAADLSDPHVPTLTPQTSLAEAFRLIESESLEDVPVVDPGDARRLLGLLSRADLIAAYNRTVASLSALPASTWLAGSEARWSDDFRVAIVPPPHGWVGRSLRDIDCRAHYGVTVLAVERDGGGRGYEMPDPDRPLASGDRLVLAGTPDGLRHAGAG